MPTALPAQLGPHKRYVLSVMEPAVRAVRAGMAVSRVSAVLGGISTDRISTWHVHLGVTTGPARRVAEAIIIRSARFHPPAASPAADVFAYLAGLLGVPAGPCMLVALNVLLRNRQA